MRWRFLVPLMGVAAAFAVLELGVRIWFFPDGPPNDFDTVNEAATRQWVPHPFLPYAGPRNARIEKDLDDGRVETITTNSYGFRSHEFPQEKRPEDYFVLCLGESTTYGYRTPENALTWPERLEALLRETYPERNVRVFNMGTDMASSAFSIVNLALIGVHVKPDLVIVYHGYNEQAALNADDYRWDHSHRFRDLAADAGVGIQARLPGWMRSSAAIFVATGALDLRMGVRDLHRAATNPTEPARKPVPEIESLLVNYNTLRSLAAGAGAEILFSTFQFRDGDLPGNQGFNGALRAEFERQGWNYIDQDRLIADRDPDLQVDECHFTQKGRDLLARNFFDAIVARGWIAPGSRGGIHGEHPPHEPHNRGAH